MARWQDFPTVTPTASDKIPIVQAAGQGLATYGSTIGAKMDKANPTGTGALSIGRKASTTVGQNSAALGSQTEASGSQAFAVGLRSAATGEKSVASGIDTVSSGTASFAEGYTTQATGQAAHSEGRNTQATANQTHAEGYGSIASGLYAHAQGNYTISNHKSQSAIGEFNIADPSGAAISARGNYIEIVGNGSNEENRSNARTLDWNGNETIAGTLTQSSDERLKDVKDEAIPDVSAVKAVRFTWKKDADRDDSEHIGYIAQDVEKVLPFLVKEDAEGNKVLDYIAFLVAKVDSLEKRIAELEK